VNREDQTVNPSGINITRGDASAKDQQGNPLFVRINARQRKDLEGINSALAIVEELKASAGPIFQANAGFFERAAAGAAQGFEEFLQTNPAITLYKKQLRGFSSRLSRSLGEVGTITDADAARTLGLFPQVRNFAGLPDTEQLANAKLEAFETFLKSHFNDILGQQVFDIERPFLDDLIKDSVDPSLLSQGASAVGEVEQTIGGTIVDTIGNSVKPLFKKFKLIRTE